MRAQRRADQVAHEAELTARQVATERDVQAALGEVQVLRKQGLEQADDPCAGSKRSALPVLSSRGPGQDWTSKYPMIFALASPRRPPASRPSIRHSDVTDELRQNVAGAMTELDQDERDRRLLAELDRIADGNEIRLLIPVSFTGVTARQYAEAFRKHGTDLMAVPTEEAAAWLKGHRHRHRLVIAIRNWHQSFPAWDVVGVVDRAFGGGRGGLHGGRRVSGPNRPAQDPKKRFEAHLPRDPPAPACPRP